MKLKSKNNFIYDLIPKNKSDKSSIKKLKKIDIDEAEPILGELLEWIKDTNWPIAKELIMILPRFHSKLIPHIKSVFESDDDIWKCYVLSLLLYFPVDSVRPLYQEIIRMAKHPTKGELAEDTYEYALNVIQKFNIKME